MKWTTIMIALLILSCSDQKKNIPVNTGVTRDTLMVKQTVTERAITKKYGNERFRAVTVQKMEASKYRIRGEAQIFEAGFNWIVEDGHHELKNGFAATDAGAPEWGKFDFTIEIPNNAAQAHLTLILFEISAKDGSRQYELPMPLE